LAKSSTNAPNFKPPCASSADRTIASRLCSKPITAARSARRDRDARRLAEPFVEIGAHFRNQRLEPVLEEVVGLGYDGMLDDGVFVGFQLINLFDDFL
jgi:hypothetical protein